MLGEADARALLSIRLSIFASEKWWKMSRLESIYLLGTLWFDAAHSFRLIYAARRRHSQINGGYVFLFNLFALKMKCTSSLSFVCITFYGSAVAVSVNGENWCIKNVDGCEWVAKGIFSSEFVRCLASVFVCAEFVASACADDYDGNRWIFFNIFEYRVNPMGNPSMSGWFFFWLFDDKVFPIPSSIFKNKYP